MKKTIQVHIGGVQFHFDEDAFKSLLQYTDALKSHFDKEGEEGREIIEDIEQRIAELLEKKLSESKQVIILSDVDEIIKTLGTVEDIKMDEEKTSESFSYDRRAHRKFYRDTENNYLGGVAAGLGAFFDIDPLWIRLAFIVLFFMKGAGLLIYAILWLVVPKAVTTAQKLHMKGKPVNVNTIEESITSEYHKVKNSFNNWSQSEKTRNAIDNIIKSISTIIKVVFKVLLYSFGIIFLIAGSILLAFIIILFFGHIDVFTTHSFLNACFLPDFSGWISDLENFKLLTLSLFFLIFIPVVSLVYAGIKIIFNIQSKSVVLRSAALTAWILALVLFLTLMFSEISNLSVKAMQSDSRLLDISNNSLLIIDVNDNISNTSIIRYSVFNYDILYNKYHETIFGQVSLVLIPASDKKNTSVVVKKYLRNISLSNADEYIDEIRYHYTINDSLITLDKYFEMDDDDFWRFGDVIIEVNVPINTRISFSSDPCEIIDAFEEDYCYENFWPGKSCIMTVNGLKAAN
ncbi:MAG: PspC domain-containing protein [Bacteroidales bacterium]|nr:PspC domain-containing protein [Bacteroidales bacterium]